MRDILTGLALVLVIEGLAYAAFPDQVKSMLIRIKETPSATLRIIGLVAAFAGVFLVWLVRP